jgi:hypothetical protein
MLGAEQGLVMSCAAADMLLLLARPSQSAPEGEDTRQQRVIKRTLVRGLTAPEHGGVLNLPLALKKSSDAKPILRDLMALISEGRRSLGLPALQAFCVDRYGNTEPI